MALFGDDFDRGLAVYAVAVLAALLTMGSLSDYVGRRPVLLAAILLQIVALVLFATASGVPGLVAARIVQGVATGGALGAVGAGLLDLDQVKGTVVSGVATVSGTAVGSLMAGAMVQLLPAPTRFVYLAVLSVLVVEGVGVVLMRDLSTRKGGAVASLRPHLAWPRIVRAPLLIATPILVAIWALAGLYASLGPSVVELLTGSRSVALGGLSLFTLASSGAVAAYVANRFSTRTILFQGTVALSLGAGGMVLAIADGTIDLFFLATVVAGVGFGFGFQGAMRSVLPLVSPQERAGVVSTIYVLSYLSLGLPAVVAGYVVANGAGVLATGKAYGSIVVGLAVAAFLGVAGRHGRSVQGSRHGERTGGSACELGRRNVSDAVDEVAPTC